MEVENAIKDADNETIAESVEEDTKEENPSDENNCEYIEDEIRSVTDFIIRMQYFQNDILQEREQKNNQATLFFRGQSNYLWDACPSLYRNEFLPIEHELISEVIRIKPGEFRNQSDFEILTKLQHYQLPTRLLDVTTNPLVALYFACRESHTKFSDEEPKIWHGSEKNKTIGYSNGIIYYKKAYPKKEDDKEIRVIASLAKKDCSIGYSLKYFLNELLNEKIYTQDEVDKCKDNNYKSLIENLQESYFVVPKFSNERLIRQSGAFLISANCNIQKVEDDFIIKKATTIFDNAFDENVILISDEYKENLLKELNMFNINEAMLFPELEHQTTYIKEKYQGLSHSEELFEKYIFDEEKEENFQQETKEKDIKEEISYEISDEESKKIINDSVHLFVKEDLNLADECIKCLNEKVSIDWYKKDSIISSMRFDLKRIIFTFKNKEFLHSSGYYTANIIDKIKEITKESTIMATDIVNKINEKVDNLIYVNQNTKVINS